MHRLKPLALTLIAVLALTAVASASASAALPEFVPSEGGKFPIALSGTSMGERSSTFNTASGQSFISPCAGYKYKGSITGAKTASLTVELTNCVRQTTFCNTAGAAQGVIVLPTTGTLVYLHKSTKQLALLLNVKELTVSCGSLEVQLKGTILAPVTPVNVKTSVIDLTFEAERGKQKPSEYETETGETKKAKFESEAGAGWIQTGFNVSGFVALSTGSPLTIAG